MVSSRVPWMTASAPRPWRCATSCTNVVAVAMMSGRGVPTMTVAGALVSQFSAAARDSMSGPVSPRTTASTTVASSRESQAPRVSAASA
ncbi:Uncharacterised protein [Mycobacteroides abscessus]|nr:Uncharacterised protein [Mycobacteroides abscessus]SIB42350.1 Uncharacterised protein [Mycobacteroides abscessus subsp. abscessus]SKL45587.1 Uncharacterised protein [Mycobacteroides abscessus subsp. abscessus]